MFVLHREFLLHLQKIKKKTNHSGLLTTTAVTAHETMSSNKDVENTVDKSKKKTPNMKKMSVVETLKKKRARKNVSVAVKVSADIPSVPPMMVDADWIPSKRGRKKCTTGLESRPVHVVDMDNAQNELNVVNVSRLANKYKMFFAIHDPTTFKKIIASNREIINECIFEFTKTGLNISKVSENVRYANIFLNQDAGMYFCSEERIHVNVSLDSFHDLIKHQIVAGDILELMIYREGEADPVDGENSGRHGASGADMLHTLVSNPVTGKKFHSQYKYTSLNNDIDMWKLPPNIKSTFSCVMPSKSFKGVMQNLRTNEAQNVRILGNRDKISFTFTSLDGSSLQNLTYCNSQTAESANIIISSDDTVDNVYLTEHLFLFSKAFSYSKDLTISMRPNAPIILVFSVKNFGYVQYSASPTKL